MTAVILEGEIPAMFLGHKSRTYGKTSSQAVFGVTKTGIQKG